MSAFSKQLGLGMQNQQNPYQGFQPIQQNALNTFQNQILPDIAERFGGANALNSSGYAGALSQAGTGLAERLAAMQSEYGQRQQQFGLDQSKLGLTSPYHFEKFDAQNGLVQQVLPILMKLLIGMA